MSAFSTPVDVRGALKRAASLVKAQKTKNASNKNNERISLAGAIVKLLERVQSPSDGMAVNMSMMLMKQMKAINKSMDKCAHKERQDERRERKSRKKRHAKKRKKKRAKKAALEGMVDHGGKTSGGSSSNTFDLLERFLNSAATTTFQISPRRATWCKKGHWSVVVESSTRQGQWTVSTRLHNFMTIIKVMCYFISFAL
jgi:hypothetical protein